MARAKVVGTLAAPGGVSSDPGKAGVSTVRGRVATVRRRKGSRRTGGAGGVLLLAAALVLERAVVEPGLDGVLGKPLGGQVLGLAVGHPVGHLVAHKVGRLRRDARRHL